MTFEEWLEKVWVPNNGPPADDMYAIAQVAWAAGYTQANHDAIANVERMNKKLFGKE